jgi:hypothetical protein
VGGEAEGTTALERPEAGRGLEARRPTIVSPDERWAVLLLWHRDTRAAVALLAGPDEWLHQRLVWWSRGSALHRFRAAAVDLLSTVDTDTYRRTRAALLLAEDRRDEAIAVLRSVAGATVELATAMAQDQPSVHCGPFQPGTTGRYRWLGRPVLP